MQNYGAIEAGVEDASLLRPAKPIAEFICYAIKHFIPVFRTTIVTLSGVLAASSLFGEEYKLYGAIAGFGQLSYELTHPPIANRIALSGQIVDVDAELDMV
jgi:hypothetical protein